MDHSDAAVLRSVLIADCGAGILGSIVHQNHLKVRVRLLQDRINAVTQVVFGVIHRHDDGNKGSGVWQGLVLPLAIILCGHIQYDMFLDVSGSNHRSVMRKSRKTTDSNVRLEELVDGEQSGIATGLDLADQRFIINGVSSLQFGNVLCVLGGYRRRVGDGAECSSCGPQLHGRIADLVSLDEAIADISCVGVLETLNVHSE